jgi:hypothetical protein
MIINNSIKDIIEKSTTTLQYNNMHKIIKRLAESKIDMSRVTKEEILAEMQKDFGDLNSPESIFFMNDIPINDRLKNYQMTLRQWTRTSTKEIEGESTIDGIKFSQWFKNLLSLVSDCPVYELSDDVVPLLANTHSAKTKLPFDSFVIDCKLDLPGETFYGFLVISSKDEDNNSGVLIYTSHAYFDENQKEIVIGPSFIPLEGYYQDSDYFEGYDKTNKNFARVREFIYSFCNFLNEREIEIVNCPVNPKNSEKRITKGLVPIPSYKVIHLTGKLKRYVGEFNAGMHKQYSHKFIVRGHFMHFRDNKKYTKLYQLDDVDLINSGYTKVNGILRKWKKPFVKGQGILVQKIEKVRK